MRLLLPKTVVCETLSHWPKITTYLIAHYHRLRVLLSQVVELGTGVMGVMQHID